MRVRLRTRELFRLAATTSPAIFPWDCAHRRRMPIAWDSRDRGVSVAPGAAPGLAGAVGQDALHSGRTRVRDGHWHGVLWAARPDRPRSPGWALELETEGNVRRERRITVT